jgi:hypothetical protein
MADKFAAFKEGDAQLKAWQEELLYGNPSEERIKELEKLLGDRTAALAAAAGVGSYYLGSAGQIRPNYAYSEASGPEYAKLLQSQEELRKALAGQENLEFTGSQGVYTKSFYGPQGTLGYRTAAGKFYDTDILKTVDISQPGEYADFSGKAPDFYDETGRKLTPEEVANTVQGQAFAAKGWDIGFGRGVLPTGTSDLLTSYTNSQNAASGFVTLSSSSSSSASSKATAEGKSAYDLLYSQFAQYGLGSLVEPLKQLIQEGVPASEFTIRLRETDAYKKRFAANAARINKGLRALSESEYIQLEDQYQDIMRRYGMPESYYARGEMGVQPGFEKFIGFDVSPVELEDRIQTAQARVFDANPEVAQTLKQFYPGITNGDVLAYVLDPTSALPELKRKITAAEIGAGAKIAGLSTGLERATELASYGVTKEQAQQGFQTIADILPRGSQLADIYKQSPYTQTTAEQEVFGLAGATEAAKQRKKLTSLEQAAFSGTSGMTGGALGRERAGQF